MSIALLPTFRPIGAVGNNLSNPSLDPVPNSPEISLVPAHFQDTATRTMIDGPNPRDLSNIVSGGPEAEKADTTGASAYLYAFGQFIDHDVDLSSSSGGDHIDIPVPDGDPTLKPGSTIAMTRAAIDPTTGTISNKLAGYLDMSQVYGSDTATATALRNPDGTLRTSSGGALPIVDNEPPGLFKGAPPGSYVSGDVRATENPELTAVTALFIREHNYWVGTLSAQHLDWSGDQLYGMAKAITTAEYQNIVYNEYLPTLIGKNAIGTYAGYDSTVNPQVTQEFSTAAFRVGHSQVSSVQNQIDNNGALIGTESLGQSFAHTPAMDQGTDSINGLLRNMGNDVSQQVDVYAVDDLRNLLNAGPADTTDLVAIDIQRERDVGLGTLNQTRSALGMTPYASFEQLSSDPKVQANLSATYGSIDKVDLFVGGLAETRANGADVGPTFQTIIADQFNRLRAGDSFWWQNQGFDNATKKMIADTKLSDIIERNAGTPAMQADAFVDTQRHLSSVAADNPSAPQLVIGVDAPGATIAGGPGDDTIVAGMGMNQIMAGGGGANVFLYNGGGHNDTISDFNPASDKIKLQTADLTAAPGDMASAMSQDPYMVSVDLSGGQTTVHMGGNTIRLPGVDPNQLHARNFLAPPGVEIKMTVPASV